MKIELNIKVTWSQKKCHSIEFIAQCSYRANTNLYLYFLTTTKAKRKKKELF